MNTNREKVNDLLDYIDDNPDSCSSWEMDFVISLDNWVGEFTEAQVDKLDNIYDRIFD